MRLLHYFKKTHPIPNRRSLSMIKKVVRKRGGCRPKKIPQVEIAYREKKKGGGSAGPVGEREGWEARRGNLRRWSIERDRTKILREDGDPCEVIRGGRKEGLTPYKDETKRRSSNYASNVQGGL